jgi:hypothetical protein
MASDRDTADEPPVVLKNSVQVCILARKEFRNTGRSIFGIISSDSSRRGQCGKRAGYGQGEAAVGIRMMKTRPAELGAPRQTSPFPALGGVIWEEI